MKSKCTIGSIAFMLAILHSGCGEEKAQTAARQAVPGTIVTAIQKDIPLQVRIIGTVEPYSTVSVKAQVSGELEAVNFKEGQDLKNGDMLFTIDTRLFALELKRAEANLTKELAQAIQTGQGGPFVFVVRSDLSVEARPVVQGKTIEGEAVVEKGLQPGEKVVIDGQLRLVPGSKVEIK